MKLTKLLSLTVATVSDLFNGPDDNADAVGDIFGVNPADDNHDFQNLAAENPDPNNNALTETDTDNDGYFESTYNPEAVVFTNTVSNPTQGTINDIIPRTCRSSRLESPWDNSDLEDGTTITITYDDGNNPVQTATYTYDSTAADLITLDSATGPDGTAGNGDDAAVTIPNILVIPQ